MKPSPSIDELSQKFRPVTDIAFRYGDALRYPEKLRRIAVRISEVTTYAHAQYLFGVHKSTIARWRKDLPDAWDLPSRKNATA